MKSIAATGRMDAEFHLDRLADAVRHARMIPQDLLAHPDIVAALDETPPAPEPREMRVVLCVMHDAEDWSTDEVAESLMGAGVAVTHVTQVSLPPYVQT